MELLLQRFSTGDESTLGLLFHELDRVSPFTDDPVLRFKCFTMEDEPNEPKIPGHTRIPAGRYQILLRAEGGMDDRYRHRFDWHEGMLWLQGVPDFEWVYIHYGNYHGDTAGCILVGDGSQSNVMEDGMVTASVAAYTRLAIEIYRALDSREVWITIEDVD